MVRYEKYKDSGFDWIGEIPEHWKVKKLKNEFSFVTGFTPPSGKSDYYENGEYIWITIRDMENKFIEDSKTKITDLAIRKFNPTLLPTMSLLYSFKLSVGKVAFNLKEVYTNEAIFSIFPNANLNLNFYYYILPSQLIKNANENIYGAKILNQELIKNAVLLIPPFQEQTAIANYLDRKTAEIDELIKQKEQLLKLYEEEKTAIINQAVTKGLTADGKGLNDYADNKKSINEIPKSNKSTVQRVKMKDSGIDWLGEIPEHWEVKKLKYLGKIKYGLGQPPKLKYDGLPLIRATNIFRGRIDENDMIFVDPEDIPYDRDPVLKEFDIIVVRSGAYTADSAIIPKKYEGAITGYDMVFRSNSNYQPEFISFVMLSNYVLNNQLIPQSLRAAQPHLNREELGETLIFIPPKKVQSQIVQYIETEINLINTKAEKTKKLIDLLGEYKQSLISEVVTGKIKVLNYDSE